MSKDKLNVPKADMLMGSMRSMGYSFESAVADIIDNSISAHCKNVHILFPETPMDILAVGILDDGDGMSDETLFEAMRYGSSSSEEDREKDDLGRFGLGLKSASLSQCRNLTVVSIWDGKEYAYSWDYKYIQEKKNWWVKEYDRDEIEKIPYISNLRNQGKGTLVVWQDFDVLEKSSEGSVYNALDDSMVVLDDSLSLIYHRYIKEGLNIYINHNKVKAKDPFLESHKKITALKERSIALSDSQGNEHQIYIKPYILPYATDLTENDKKKIGGIESLRMKQGFYIYRNKRLIIWGTWFGMKPRGELTKNARIRVDIPNSLDDIWQIDIKKQTATIPKRIQNQLKNTVLNTVEISTKKQTYRGRKESIDDKIDYVWARISGRDNMYYYQINRESKLYQYIKEKVTEDDFIYMEMLLKEIEMNLPIQQLYIDKSRESVTIKETNVDERLNEVYQLGISCIDMGININPNNSPEELIKRLMVSEPFCNFPQVSDLLIKNYSHGNNK